MLFAKAHVARLTSLVRTDKVEDKVGFKYFLFSPLPGEMIQFDEHISQMGSNHQLDKV